MKNIVLIGMPGSGKSTVGVLLAKRLGMNFIDTDIVIQQRENRPLSELVDRATPDNFRRLEEQHVLGVNVSGHVIATGGSVIYGDLAMRHLRLHGRLVYLFTPLALLEMRIHDLAGRGVLIRPSQSLRELLEERHPLYTHYADLVIDCIGRNHEAVVSAVKAGLETIPSTES